MYSSLLFIGISSNIKVMISIHSRLNKIGSVNKTNDIWIFYGNSALSIWQHYYKWECDKEEKIYIGLGVYLVNRICVLVVVVFGNLQAVQNTSISVEGSDINRVTWWKKRRPPIIDQSFINYNETLHIIESLPPWFPMQRNQILLVLTKPSKIRIQHSYPPHLLNFYHISYILH